jgi:hypothetical protein
VVLDGSGGDRWAADGIGLIGKFSGFLNRAFRHCREGRLLHHDYVQREVLTTRVVEPLLLSSFGPGPLQAELPTLSQSKIRKVAAYSVALSCCYIVNVGAHVQNI